MDKIDAILQALNFPSFYIKVVLSFLTSLLITYFSIPTIIKISRRKNLMDEPGQRSSHERKIPNKNLQLRHPQFLIRLIGVATKYELRIFNKGIPHNMPTFDESVVKESCYLLESKKYLVTR